MKRRALFVSIVGVATSLLGSTAPARAADPVCLLDGVRFSLVDAGATSELEISARVRPQTSGTTTCSIAWSMVSLSAPAAGGGTPAIAIADAFVDHVRRPPLILADGASSATARDWTSEVGDEGAVVSVRWIVEGTDDGLRIELPRAMFPRASDGARFERRVKTARSGKADFGSPGSVELSPTDSGPAGGIGPTGPFDEQRVTIEFVPSADPISAKVAPSAFVLDAFRDALPRRVLDLSPENEAGWDDVARHAYAAAVHADPVVASLGVGTLAWLASGLELKASRIAATAGAPDVAVVPASVASTIGDVDGRLRKKLGAVGRLLPLGRSATFRRVLAAAPWGDEARAKAAKNAVARLATLDVGDLAKAVTPAIIETTAPIDPPTAAPTQMIPTPIDGASASPSTSTSSSSTASLADGKPRPTTHARPRRRSTRRPALIAASIVLIVIALGAARIRSRKPA